MKTATTATATPQPATQAKTVRFLKSVYDECVKRCSYLAETGASLDWWESKEGQEERRAINQMRALTRSLDRFFNRDRYEKKARTTAPDEIVNVYGKPVR